MSILISQSWPLPYGYDTFTSAYGPRVVNSEYDFHWGFDLRAEIGTPVYASLSGEIVVILNNTTDEGYGIKIYNENTGEGTAYYHLNGIDNELVEYGDFVSEGDLIAYSGDTGVSEPHLHFNYYVSGYLNANTFHPLNLLPIDNYMWPSPEITSATCDVSVGVAEATITVETLAEQLDFIGFKLVVWYYDYEIDFDLSEEYRTDNNPITFYMDEFDSNTEVILTTTPHDFDYNYDDTQVIEFHFDLSQFTSFEIFSSDLCFYVRDVEDWFWDEYQDYECTFTPANVKKIKKGGLEIK